MGLFNKAVYMKPASILLTLSIVAFSFTGCSKEDQKPITNRWINNTVQLLELNKDKPTITEGIAGTLTLIEGNCMPMIPRNSTCREYPVQRTIKIYPYTTMQEVNQIDFVYFTIDAAPILTVESDAEGFYQASLPPGTYSVFVQENGKLYANSFDGQRGINPVQVEEDSLSTLNLRLDYAVY